MDTRLTAEQIGFAQVVRKFLAEEAPLGAQRDRPDPTQVWLHLAELGVAGLLVDEADGGLQLDPLDACVVAEELGARAATVPFLTSAVYAVAVMQAVDGNTAALQAEVAAGIAAVVLEAPNAVAGPGGRLDFNCRDVLDASRAQIYLVSTDNGLFRVDADSGVDVVARSSVDPTRPLADVRVSASAQFIGAVDAGKLARATDLRTLVMVADGVGAAQAAHSMAREYATTREQFGKPIGTFQAVQHLCVDMYTAIDAVRLGVRAAAWLIAQDDPRARYSVAASAIAGANLSRVSAMAIQVLGGIGYTWEHDVQLLHKRLLSLRAMLPPDSARTDRILAALGAT